MDLESSETKLKEATAHPVPQEFEYIEKQVMECRSIMRKERCTIYKPKVPLRLGPLPAGKEQTLVLDMDLFMLVTQFENDPLKPSHALPTWEPDKMVHVPQTARARQQTYKVWYRPNLEEFLAAVSVKYEIVVFSANAKAQEIIETLDSEGKYISHVFSVDSLSTYMFERLSARNVLEPDGDPVMVKDIRGLFECDHPRLEKTVVCVDDTITYFIRNLSNVVPIRPFHDDANDSELKKLASILLALADVDDVDEDIKKRCNLPELMGPESWAYITEKDQPTVARPGEAVTVANRPNLTTF